MKRLTFPALLLVCLSACSSIPSITVTYHPPQGTNAPSVDVSGSSKILLKSSITQSNNTVAVKVTK